MNIILLIAMIQLYPSDVRVGVLQQPIFTSCKVFQNSSRYVTQMHKEVLLNNENCTLYCREFKYFTVTCQTMKDYIL